METDPLSDVAHRILHRSQNCLYSWGSFLISNCRYRATAAELSKSKIQTCIPSTPDQPLSCSFSSCRAFPLTLLSLSVFFNGLYPSLHCPVPTLFGYILLREIHQAMVFPPGQYLRLALIELPPSPRLFLRLHHFEIQQSCQSPLSTLVSSATSSERRRSGIFSKSISNSCQSSIKGSVLLRVRCRDLLGSLAPE